MNRRGRGDSGSRSGSRDAALATAERLLPSHARYHVGAMPEDAVAFTVYVRELGSGDEPSPAVFEAAWNKLRRVLISELRKRALWSAPPSYLG
ncbi:MAG: hypothetical protein GY856_06545, partial [bacterium]|nr:hypothetical protein [bacterium]